MDASADNYAVKAIGRHKSNQKVYLFCLACLLLLPLVVIIGFHIAGKPLVELASAAPNYVPVVVLMACALLLNRRILKDLQRCADVIDGLQIENINLQWELDACRNENSKLRKELAESERKREETEALVASYREKIPKELLELEDAIGEMLKLNGPQRVQQQEYPHSE